MSRRRRPAPAEVVKRPELIDSMLTFAPIQLREYVEMLEAEVASSLELRDQNGQGKLRLEAEVPLSDLDEKRMGSFVRDSSTSRQAALDAYPRQDSARRRVIEALARGPLTRDELASVLSMPANTVRPRVAELVEGGWIVSTDSTRKTKTGSNAEVLELSAKAMAAR